MEVRRIGKLVRDRIPGIILENGDTPDFRFMGDDELLPALGDKLEEEVAEYMASGDIEELADVLQVIYSISEIIGGGPGELEYLREEKAAARGRFDMGVFLESVVRKD